MSSGDPKNSVSLPMPCKSVRLTPGMARIMTRLPDGATCAQSSPPPPPSSPASLTSPSPSSCPFICPSTPMVIFSCGARRAARQSSEAVRCGTANGKELEGGLPTGLEETPRLFASAFVNVKENYPQLLSVSLPALALSLISVNKLPMDPSSLSLSLSLSPSIREKGPNGVMLIMSPSILAWWSRPISSELIQIRSGECSKRPDLTSRSHRAGKDWERSLFQIQLKGKNGRLEVSSSMAPSPPKSPSSSGSLRTWTDSSASLVRGKAEGLARISPRISETMEGLGRL